MVNRTTQADPRPRARGVEVDPDWLRYQLAYDLAIDQQAKIERMQSLPLFRIAEGDNIDDVVRELTR